MLCILPFNHKFIIFNNFYHLRVHFCSSRNPLHYKRNLYTLHAHTDNRHSPLVLILTHVEIVKSIMSLIFSTRQTYFAHTSSLRTELYSCDYSYFLFLCSSFIPVRNQPATFDVAVSGQSINCNKRNAPIGKITEMEKKKEGERAGENILSLFLMLDKQPSKE